MSGVRNALRVLDPIIGGPLLSLARRRDRGVALLYHRVSAEDGPDSPPLHPETFREHLDLLSGLFDVLTLDEFVTRMVEGKSLRACCTLTFDDGYADFLTDALPALTAKGLPSTHFLVVDSVLTGRPPWNARLARLLRLEPSPLLDTFPDHDESQVLDTSRALDGGPQTGRRPQVLQSLSRMPWGERDAYISEWEGRVEGLRDPPPPMIRADSLVRLANSGVEVGAHTLSHCFLTRVAPDEAVRELRDSRLELEKLAGGAVRFTSYPQGLYDPTIESMAERSGFCAAFAVDQRPAFVETSRYAIPRFDVTDRPTWMLRMELSGFIPWLRRLRRS